MKLCSLTIVVICICGCDVNPAERNNAGNSLYAQGQYDSALAAYKAAQVVSPDSPEAYFNAASAYDQTGDFDKAIENLQQALKTASPDLKMRIYYNLGNIYFQMYRIDNAVIAYQQALLLNPNDEDARHNLELAIERLIIPSPTPVSPTYQPTDVGKGGATPTSELSIQPSAGASITPQPSASNPDNATAIPNANDLLATISVDDAKGILDSVQQAQQGLPNPLLSGTPQLASSGKDW